MRDKILDPIPHPENLWVIFSNPDHHSEKLQVIDSNRHYLSLTPVKR